MSTFLELHMKILISVDIEGVAGVVHSEQCRPGNPEYEHARAWMTAEANAAALGAFEGGASEVRVADSHAGFRNLLLDQLDARVRVVTGKPRYLGMVAGVQGCDAAFFVGYHAGAGRPGVLSHTISSFAFHRVCVNGVELNEAGLYGALAAEHGVPVALLCGDDAFIAETRERFPGVLTVETKQAGGRVSATTLSPAQSCRAIRVAAREAIASILQLQAHRLEGSTFRCELVTQSPDLADLFCQWPSLERLDANTLAFDAPSMEALIRILNSLSAMSFMLR